jgi:hypothetical protein
MGKAIRASLLILLLTCSAQAGYIPNDTPAPPPPQPANAVQEPTNNATLNGDISTPSASDILTQTVLDMLALLPSLL